MVGCKLLHLLSVPCSRSHLHHSWLALCVCVVLPLQANIALNNSALPQPRPQGNPEPVLGQQLTTAPGALRVLFLSDVQYARVCSNSNTYSSAVVVHCQTHNSGAAKRAFLHRVGLWMGDRAAEQAVQV